MRESTGSHLPSGNQACVSLFGTTQNAVLPEVTSFASASALKGRVTVAKAMVCIPMWWWHWRCCLRRGGYAGWGGSRIPKEPHILQCTKVTRVVPRLIPGTEHVAEHILRHGRRRRRRSSRRPSGTTLLTRVWMRRRRLVLVCRKRRLREPMRRRLNDGGSTCTVGILCGESSSRLKTRRPSRRDMCGGVERGVGGFVTGGFVTGGFVTGGFVTQAHGRPPCLPARCCVTRWFGFEL